jgi:hypothetical protein
VVRLNEQIEASSLLGVFLSRHGRLPDFAQRRLDSLILKRKSGRLTRAEQRELTDSLNYIDDTSIELLAYAAEQAPRASRKRRASGTTTTRPPLWKRYMDRRLRDLCNR